MTLGQFSVIVGAPKRWVQNAFQALGLRSSYSEVVALTLSLARVVKQVTGMPLRRAYPMAEAVLGRWPMDRTWEVSEPGGSVQVTIDLEQFQRQYAARLSLARTRYVERRRGRPLEDDLRGLALAEWYGVDISLLQASLALSPAQRLQRIEEAAAFFRDAEVQR